MTWQSPLNKLFVPFRRNKVYASWKLYKTSISVNRGSHFQVRFVWQVWDGQLSPSFKYIRFWVIIDRPTPATQNGLENVIRGWPKWMFCKAFKKHKLVPPEVYIYIYIYINNYLKNIVFFPLLRIDTDPKSIPFEETKKRIFVYLCVLSVKPTKRGKQTGRMRINALLSNEIIHKDQTPENDLNSPVKI